MNFTDRLDFLMCKAGLNKHTLAQNSGVPYTTIIGFYTRGYENTKLSTIRQLANYFNVSMDYLMSDEEKVQNGSSTLLASWASLNLAGQRILLDVADALVGCGSYDKKSATVDTVAGKLMFKSDAAAKGTGYLGTVMTDYDKAIRGDSHSDAISEKDDDTFN